VVVLSSVNTQGRYIQEEIEMCAMTKSELLEKFGKPIKVLDKGHVRLVDVMGDDDAVVQAARVSYGVGTKTMREDEGLIRYLTRKYHTTPSEMCEIKLHVKVPMDAWRQWIRHRTASVNEYSTRYSEAIDERQQTAPGEWRSQSSNNKQGSGAFLDEDVGQALTKAEAHAHASSRATYSGRLGAGVAREQARKDLPLSTYTEAYWKVDLHNLLHFLRLRLDSHAQLEIRLYAEAIAEIVKAWVPVTWKAFEDYRLNSHTFSGPEMKLLKAMLGHGPDGLNEGGIPTRAGMRELADQYDIGANSERKEFWQALGYLE